MYCKKCGLRFGENLTYTKCPFCGTPFHSESEYRYILDSDNLYEILQVSPKASKEIINNAYKVLAKKYHPDLNVNNEESAAIVMKKLNNARDILIDESKRSEYDFKLFKEKNESENKSHSEYQTYQQPSSAQMKSEYTYEKPETSVKQAPSVFFRFIFSKFGCITIIIAIILIISGISSLLDDSANDNNKSTSSSQLYQVAFPSNGLIEQSFSSSNSNDLAPLTFITSSSQIYYYIKVINDSTNQVVLTAFAYPNSKLELEVPVGTYRIRCASGKTWYGFTDIFGSNGSYEEFDDKFRFYISGNTINGYTIELYEQIDGNLDSTNISKRDF